MKSTKNRDRNITHFLYVLPNLIMYSFLSIVPIVLGLYYSFTNWNGIGKNYKFVGLKNYIKILSTIILSYNFPSERTDEILNLFTGFLHGFTTLQVRYAFSDPQKVRNDLCNSIDTILLGLRQKYECTGEKE